MDNIKNRWRTNDKDQLNNKRKEEELDDELNKQVLGGQGEVNK